MPTALNGFVTAIVAVLDGTVGYVVLKGFVDAGVVSSIWLLIYALANILGILAFVHSTKYWGTLYLFGWWFGFGIMWYSGLVESWEFIVSSIVLSIILITRFLRHFDDFND
jgi:hypothetical protein